MVTDNDDAREPTPWTPGPWHVEPLRGEDDEQFWSDDWNGKVFCVCHPRTECDATTVVGWINEGDARLIAAAPALYEALAGLVAAPQGALNLAKTWEPALVALSLARGEQA